MEAKPRQKIAAPRRRRGENESHRRYRQRSQLPITEVGSNTRLTASAPVRRAFRYGRSAGRSRRPPA
jgi:hypothetical protein